MNKEVKMAEEKSKMVPILADLSTGLANQKTKPRRIPEAFFGRTVGNVLNHLQRIIEKKGDVDECHVVACVHDQMREDYVIKVNEINIGKDAIFSNVVKEVTKVEDIGEEGKSKPVRVVNFIITKVDDGGNNGFTTNLFL